MGTSYEVVNDKLVITETKDTVVANMDRSEVVGKIAEVQTAIDHLEIDIAAKEAEKTKWVAYLAALGK